MKYILQTPFESSEHTPMELAPELQTYGLRLYIDAWAAYVDAGCPLGEDEDAMYLWYLFNQPEGKGWTFRN